MTDADDDTGSGPRLRVGFVPGVQPDKWFGRWRERRPEVPVTGRRVSDPLAGLAAAAGEAGFDVVFVREPDEAPRSAPRGLLRIPLYTETMAVLAERDHPLGAFDALTTGDLTGERWLDPVDTVTAELEEVEAAVDLVAAGVGLLVVPLPYARSLSRKDVVERPLEGVSATRIGVAWSPSREGDELIDEFVGIVRGRSATSSRGASRPPHDKPIVGGRATPGARARARARSGTRRRGRRR